MTIELPQLLSPAETARALGIQERTLNTWRHLGRYPDLPFIRVGKSIRYSVDDVKAFLDSRTVGGPKK